MDSGTRCVSCGELVLQDERFCGTCGTPVERKSGAEESRGTAGGRRTRPAVGGHTAPCTKCGTDLLPEEVFCPTCGLQRTGRISGISSRIEAARTEELERVRNAIAREYAIIRELGRGGMATVYLADDLSLPRKVAIKVIAPQLTLSEEAVERFVNEARTMAGLTHGNIVPIYAVRETPLHLFVMPFIEGQSLEEIHRRVRPLPIAVVQAVVYQVASALAHGHGRPKPVIHRDVKPANIMINEAGNAIVTDFGIAKEVAEAPGTKSTKTPIGTFEYMSPEQIRMSGISGASDQYSLGVVAYELITGRLPFQGTQGELMDAHRYQDCPPIERSDCPPEVADAVMRMLEKDPADRWPTILVAAQAMGGAVLQADDPVRVYLASLSSGAPIPDVPLVPLVPSLPDGEARRQWSRTPSLPVSRIEVRVPDRPLPIGETVQLRAILIGEDGTVLPNQAVTWRSAKPDVAEVSATGRVTALSEGTVSLLVTCQGRECGAEIVVVRPEVARVNVTGARDRLFVGESLTLDAWATDSRGTQTQDRPVLWTATPETVVVTSSGTVTALRPGTATVTAEIEGKRGSIDLRVLGAPVASVWIAQEAVSLEAGATQQLSVRLKDTGGRPVYDREVRWSSSRPGVVVVSAEGVATAVSVGAATLTATVEDQTATVEVAVNQAAAASIRIGPHPALLRVGRGATLTATAEDRSGRPLSGRTVSWSSDRPDIVAVSANGKAKGVSPGSAVITANCEGVEATLRLNVEARRSRWPIPVALATAVVGLAIYQLRPPPEIVDPPSSPPLATGSVAFEAGPDRVRVGDSLVLAAQVRDSTGAPVDMPRTFSSRSPSVVQVVGDKARFISQGQAWILVQSGEHTDSIRIEVLPAAPVNVAVAALEFESSSIEVEQGESLAVRVTAKDSAGVLALGKPIRMTTAAGGIAVARRHGATWFVVGMARGTTGLRAAVDSVEATSSVEVKPARPALVEISPDPVNLVVGDTARLRARLLDARNQPTEGVVTWASAEERRATVSAEGVVTARESGSVRVSAQTANGKRGFAVVTIEPKGATSGTGGGTEDSSGKEKETVAPAVFTASRIVAGGFPCSFGEKGLLCWGGGREGPVPVGGGLSHVSVGGLHACGLTNARAALCWGSNSHGQLGTGNTAASGSPQPVVGNLRFSSIAAGASHSCGVADGVVYCWGRNGGGQLGDQGTASRSEPAPVKGGNLPRFKEVTAGTDHTCALSEDGVAYCWGDDVSGAVGVGAKQRESEPTAIGKGKFTFTGLWAGARHTCGLTAQGVAYCWGDNQNGQVGIGSRNEEVRLEKAVQGNQAFRELTLGENHTCGVTRDGTLYCWGNNKDGQLGDNSDQARTRPVQSAGGQTVLAAGAGDGFTCAVTTEKAVICWGRNSARQLGDGTTQNRLEPVPVRPPRAP